jgi:hypothetical protein
MTLREGPTSRILVIFVFVIPDDKTAFQTLRALWTLFVYAVFSIRPSVLRKIMHY